MGDDLGAGQGELVDIGVIKGAQLFPTSDVTTVGDLLRVCRTVRALSLHCPERFPVFETVKQRERAEGDGVGVIDVATL